MPIVINNLKIDEKTKQNNKLVKYQIGQIRKAENEISRAQEVRKLWKIVGEKSSAVRELGFSSKQEDADEFIGEILNCLYDSEGPVLETSLTKPRKEEDIKKLKNRISVLGSNQSMIKIPIQQGKTLSHLLDDYQKEEELDKKNSYKFETNTGEVEFDTNKKLSLFVTEDQKEVFVELKRFEVEVGSDGKAKFIQGQLSKSKIDTDVTIDDIDVKSSSNPKELESSDNVPKKRFIPTAFVRHNGNLNGGHYYSYVKERENNGKENWYCYNDSSRSEVEERDAKNAMKQAYIVKYSAVKNENGIVDLPSVRKANDKSWSQNLGNTCWANSSVAIVANSKLGEECEKIVLTDEEKKEYERINAYSITITPKTTTSKPKTQNKKATVTFLTNNILDQKVDVVVNAGNANLRMGQEAGGLSGAFHSDIGTDAFANALAEQNTGVLKQGSSNLEQGKVAVVKVDEINNIKSNSKIKENAKYIIHAVGPDCKFKEFETNAEARKKALEQAYQATFDKAKELNAKTIAIPALSIGVFKFPIEEAAKIIADVIKKNEGDFKEIKLCCLNDKGFINLVESHYHGREITKPKQQKQPNNDNNSKPEPSKNNTNIANNDSSNGNKIDNDPKSAIQNSQLQPRVNNANQDTVNSTSKKNLQPQSKLNKVNNTDQNKNSKSSKVKINNSRKDENNIFSIDDLVFKQPNSEKQTTKTKNNVSFRNDALNETSEKNFLETKQYNSIEKRVEEARKPDLVFEKIKEMIQEKEKLPKVEESKFLTPVLELEKEIEKEVKNKNLDKKEFKESGENGYNEFKKYVEEKYKDVELKIFRQYSEEKPDIKTLELLEKEIQKKDEVVTNKVARALAELANISDSKGNKSNQELAESFKELTTLSRRALVDLYNKDKSGDKVVEFKSLYREAKNEEKAELTIQGKNYVLDESKFSDVGEIIKHANSLIPSNLVENPSSKKISESSRSL